MATVVSVADPRVQAALRVDDEGRLLVAVKGGGGGGANVDLSAYDTRDQADAKYAKASEVPGQIDSKVAAAVNGLVTKSELSTAITGKVTTDQLAAAVSGVPRTVAILKYAGVRCGGQAPTEWLTPLGTLDKTNSMTSQGAWPAVRAQDNLVCFMPEVGVYSCQVIVNTPSTQVVYLKDGQGTLAELEGPKDSSRPVTLGSGITFVFRTDIPNRLVRIPLAAPGSSRPNVGDCTFVFTKLL